MRSGSNGGLSTPRSRVESSQELRSSCTFLRADRAYSLSLEAKSSDDRSGTIPAILGRMSEAKCCVYALRSCTDRTRYYTGVTSDWGARLESHNAGRCLDTENGRAVADRCYRRVFRREASRGVRALSEILVRLRLRQTSPALRLLVARSCCIDASCLHHSARNATVGSIVVAARAGQ